MAGDAAVDAAREARQHLDALIYPIVFLYRQYLELSLKLILFYVRALLDEKGDVPGTHNLLALWETCQKGIARVSDGSLRKHCEVLDQAIRQFAVVDPSSFMFRYPVDRQGTPVEIGPERMNVLHLKEEMANVALATEVISGGLSARVDLRNEFAQDMGG